MPTTATPSKHSAFTTVVPHPHWVIPFAASLSEPCQRALPHLDSGGRLPHLRALLQRLSEVARLEGDEYALSMPHERVLAAELGWPDPHGDADGRLPWGAWWAAQDGLQLDVNASWALLSPGHWQMGRESLTLLDPQQLGLDEGTSKALLEALRPLFEDDGWQLHWGGPTRWYATHPALNGLPTASLDRVVGRNPDLWLSPTRHIAPAPTDHPTGTGAMQHLRRLQAEVQMALYQHPLNDAREAAGLPTVNSFWVSGCGRLPDGRLPTWPDGLTLCHDLRSGLLSDDMPVWVDAWEHLDATVLADLVKRLGAQQPIHLTLCGERHAVTLGAPPTSPSKGLWGHLKRTLHSLGSSKAPPPPSAFLAQL